MAHISYLFLSSDSLDLLDEGGNIMSSQLLPTEHPVVSILTLVETGVAKREAVTAIVTQPNIVTSSGELESGSNRGVMVNPDHVVDCEAMNQEDWMLVSRCLVESSRDPIEAQNITIVRDDLVLFTEKAIFVGDLLKSLEIVHANRILG
jgi:hypothetical protein